MSKGKTRYVEELHRTDPDHNPTSSELQLERSVANETEPGSAKMEPSSSIEETHAKQFEIQTNPVYNYSEEVIPIEERKWNDIPACKHFRGHTFEAEVLKLVIDWYVSMTKTKRKQTALFIGIRWVQNCEKHFKRLEGKNYRTRIGFNTFMNKNSRNVLLYIRAIQGHTGGNLTAPELMGHVCIPYKWKEFLFHRACSYDVTSILKSGLIAGG